MSTNHVLLVGTIAVGLVLVGCDDDEAEIDAAVRDAAVVEDAAADADTGDDAAAEDAAMGGEAFSSTLALTTEEEVPVCAAAGADAQGSGTVTIDAADTTIEVMDLTYSGLSGTATGAHIHFGAPGVAGPIVLDLGPDLTSPIDRTFMAADYPTPAPAGAPATFAAFVAAMRAGQTYVNIHTEDCAPGEIRDQIE